MPPSSQRNNMSPPNQHITNMLIVKRIIKKGDSRNERDRYDRQITDRLGRTINPAALMSAHHQGKSGKYTKGAIPLSRVIEGFNKPNSQSLAKAAARKKEKAEVSQRTKQLLEHLKQPQTAGYKKPKPKPKKK